MVQLCHCDFCQCRNQAQQQEQEAEDGSSSPSSSSSPSPSPINNQLLCLVCENARLWSKTSPTYRGCLCVCKCKLERAPGSFQCQDCLEENGKNHRRHRLHGKPKEKIEQAADSEEDTNGSSP